MADLGRDPGPARRRIGVLAWLTLALGIATLLVSATGSSTRSGAGRSSSGAIAAPAGGWVEIDYGRLVDRRKVGHSGESVGRLLARLQGRPYPPPGERPEDAALHGHLDPLLEPYAFVLPDALDSLVAVADPPFVEVGDLWRPGEAQPAWAQLLRDRRFLVESDGSGHLRAFVPWAPPSSAPGAPAEPARGSGAVAEEAWRSAWPVLRHVLAAEQRRLAARDGGEPRRRALDVEVHAYVHEPARTIFRLGVEPYRVHVEDTEQGGNRRPLDFDEWRAFLERRLLLEGGRLEPDGTLHLLGSPSAVPPAMLGRPLSLSDFAVAYRAVFHGGAAEPYMSLDRGDAPDVSNVNFGGRLQDTALGLVSLRADIRFKTFSLGIDVVEGRDVRDRLRRALPSFRTHLERFASVAGSQQGLGQQTRFWFYPDDVSVTLSPEGDVLVMRRARMTAAAERLGGGGRSGPAEEEPPWTRETIAAINGGYDALAGVLPELPDLDQAARLLTFFTWLRQAGAEGRALPDLDALLDIPVDSLPTPRRFPQLLAFNALPPAGGSGEVDVLNRADVAGALDRLRPGGGEPLPARRRLQRALASLDRQLPDHATLAKEIEAVDPSTLDDDALDAMSYQAERLVMHRLVLDTLAEQDRKRMGAREKASGPLRVFSVGIGGVDLGMGKALERAARGPSRLAWGGASAPARERSRPPAGGESPAAPVSSAGSVGARSSQPPPALDLPDHGLLAPGRAEASREFGTSWIRRGVASSGAAPGAWLQVVMGADGPDVRSRRLILDGDRRARLIERVEEMRFLRFSMEKDGERLLARPVAESPAGPAAAAASDRKPVPPSPGSAPPPVTLLEVLASPAADTGAESPAVKLRLRPPGKPALEAAFPRQVLERLVLGPEVDLSPGKPLPGLGSPEQVLGGARRLMSVMDRASTAPPWVEPARVATGEEDPVRLAAALTRWWAAREGGGGSPPVVVATDPQRSAERWATSPSPVKGAILLLPENAFPGPAAPLRESLVPGWGSDRVVPSLAARALPDLVVLASAEPPALLGARLRAIARDPAMRGKLLAVWPIAGPIRGDLPASLLEEGQLAGIGVAPWSPVGLPAMVKSIARLGEALATSSPPPARVEELAREWIWYF